MSDYGLRQGRQQRERIVMDELTSAPQMVVRKS